MMILNKNEIFTAHDSVVYFIFGIFIFVLLGLAFEKYIIGFIFAILAALSLFGTMIFGMYKMPTGKYEYEVILEDDYPVSELYESYEIIDQRGEIWVIKDKE